MKIRLDQVTTIFTGATLREKPEYALHPNSYLMQLGDLDASGHINYDNMLPFFHRLEHEKFIVKSGDLVFRGRGAGIAVAVMQDTQLPVIVASPLIIIRLDHKKVDPDYLAWALTTDDARRYYAQYARGSSIIGIGMRDLEALEIQISTLQFQRKIGRLKNLQAKEAQLIASYQAARIKLIETFINDSIHKEKAA